MFSVLGSRDGKLVTWNRNENKAPTTVLGKYDVASEPLELTNESVTAVAFASEMVADTYLVAIGLDCGLIHLFSWCVSGWKKLLSLSQRYILVLCSTVYKFEHFTLVLEQIT